MKIAIGVPSNDIVQSDFAFSLAAMIGYTSQCLGKMANLAVINARSSLIQKGRQSIVNQAIDIGADKILWIDSDMFFPPDSLIALLRHRKACVGCNYARRTPPFDGVASGLQGDTGLVRAKTMGFGMMLVDTEVHKKKGWFQFKVCQKDGNWVGEDENWCKGVEVWCDCDLSKKIGHVGKRIYMLGEEDNALQS
jgi:hypothetical protein